MYVLIEFSETGGGDNSVAIVRKSWLSPRKRDVFWPPIKNQKAFDRTLTSETNDDIETWKIYPIARCLYETDDLEKAKKKLKLSEVTSDLLSDHSDEPLKRRKVVPRRYISSDEESDESNRPPQLNKRLKTILKESQLEAEETAPGYRTSQPKQNKIYQKHCLTQEETASSQEVDHFADGPVVIQNTAHGNNLNTSKAENIAANALLDSTGFHETVVNILSHIKIQNAQILALLQNKERTTIQEFPFTFPLKSLDDIQALEDLLEDKKHVNDLISYLATIGGRDLSSKVTRILKHDGCSYKMFKKIKYGKIIFMVLLHRIADCYGYIKGKKLVQIHNILVNCNDSNSVLLYGKPFSTYNSFYTYPYDSKITDIFVVQDLSDDLIKFSLDDIIAKCIVIPTENNSWISLPLINTF